MKQSRAYQKAIENDIPYKLKEYKHILIQSPTGSGKSHIINKMVQRIMAVGKTALVLSDTIKIHGQLSKECNAFTIEAKIKSLMVLPGQCYVAMTQTLQRRDEIIEQFKSLGDSLVLIVDEAHRGTMNTLIDEINPYWMIGFTATPHYKWAKHLPKYYNYLIHGPQIKMLIEDNHLCHYRHTVRTGADLTQLKLKAGEFTEASQDKVFGNKKMYDGLLDDLPKFHKNKTVIYVASIQLCELLTLELKEHGYKVCKYHSEWKWDLYKFTETNECDICVSVSALTLGWDFPPIDLIVLWRATGSLPLYLQICGRGARPFENKKQFDVLDYGGNFERFGAWSMDRDWNELWKPQKKKRQIGTYAGVSGSKECPVCHVLLNVSARVCDNCGYIYPMEEMKLVEGKLVEVQNTLSAMNGKTVGTLTAAELAIYAKEKDKRAHAIRVAKRMEQDFPGFLESFANEMGYKKGWVQEQKKMIPNDMKISFFNSTIKI